MRRARLKVVPNLGSASRLSKLAETPAGVVVDESPNVPSSANEEVTLPSNPIVTNENFVCPKLEKKPVSLPSLNGTLAADSQAIALPPSTQISGSSSSCIDKENVVAVVQDEVSSENQVSTTVEDQNHSGLSLSRYKARNKIRPVIRDAPHRIRTFSSASESEDDAGKKQSRTPLSPVKKSPVKKDNVELTPPPAKIEHVSKGKKKASEKTPLELKKAAMRKKLATGQVDRSQLTMFDLIYYNPTDGDRPPQQKEKLQMRLKPYEVEALANESKTIPKETTDNPILDELLAEEEEMRQIEENPDIVINKEEKEVEVEEDEDEEEEAMPVPQVRLGPDGEIILDDQSLVIDTSEARRNKTQLANAPLVIENSATLVNYGSWRKRQRSARWSLRETARFYRALSMLGTNFSLMEKLFPNRPRVELKRKFKNEEKINPQLVDKIISSQIPFDPTLFIDNDDCESSEAESTKKTKKTPKTGKMPKVKEGKCKAQKKTTAEECDSTLLEDSQETPTKKTAKRRKKGTDETELITENSETDSFKPPKKRRTKGKAILPPSLTSSTDGKKGKKSKKPITPSEVDENSSSDEETPTTSQVCLNDSASTVAPADLPNNSNLTTFSSTSSLDNLLKSPLGQMSLEQGGLTVVENTEAPEQAPSFLVPPALAEANPAFAQAEPGSLVLVTNPNPDDPNNQMVHVYRISVPLEPVP